MSVACDDSLRNVLTLLQARMKELEAHVEQEKVEQRRVAEVERRKTLEEEAKHAKARIDYQQQLEKKRKEEELQMQRAMQVRKYLECLAQLCIDRSGRATAQAGGVSAKAGRDA